MSDERDRYRVWLWWIIEVRDPAAPKGYRRVSYADPYETRSKADARNRYRDLLRAGCPANAVDWGVAADFPIEEAPAVPCPAELRARLGSFKLKDAR